MNRNQGRGRIGRTSKSNGRFGIDDLTYDLVTILHEKSKGLEAYQRDIDDARTKGDVRQMLERFRDDDLRKVHELRDCLSDVLGDDSHRM